MAFTEFFAEETLSRASIAAECQDSRRDPESASLVPDRSVVDPTARPRFPAGIEPFPASRGGIYRVRAMEVNTPEF